MNFISIFIIKYFIFFFSFCLIKSFQLILSQHTLFLFIFFCLNLKTFTYLLNLSCIHMIYSINNSLLEVTCLFLFLFFPFLYTYRSNRICTESLILLIRLSLKSWIITLMILIEPFLSYHRKYWSSCNWPRWLRSKRFNRLATLLLMLL